MEKLLYRQEFYIAEKYIQAKKFLEAKEVLDRINFAALELSENAHYYLLKSE
jgi:hypothetical protein